MSIDNGDEPLVSKAVLRGFGGGFLEYSNFRCSEIFPSANIGVMGFGWRERPGSFLLSCQDSRKGSLVSLERHTQKSHGSIVKSPKIA